MTYKQSPTYGTPRWEFRHSSPQPCQMFISVHIATGTGCKSPIVAAIPVFWGLLSVPGIPTRVVPSGGLALTVSPLPHTLTSTSLSPELGKYLFLLLKPWLGSVLKWSLIFIITEGWEAWRREWKSRKYVPLTQLLIVATFRTVLERLLSSIVYHWWNYRN